MAVKRTKAAAKKKAPKAPEPFFRPFARLAAPAPITPPLPAKSSARRASTSAKAPPVNVELNVEIEIEIEIETETETEPALIDPRTFAIYMSGVRALSGKASRIPLTANRIERAPAAATPPPDLDVGARAQMRSLITEGVRFETTDDGERVEGRRLDVDPRELRRLRRAQYAIDGKLDLHGHGVDDARRAVEAFVKKRAEIGDKVVAIVHGKGTHSPRQNGVLRGEIGAWLSQGRAARHVLAFTTPPEDEGGTGAVLVLLAR